jgi:hypothetical protein
MVYLGNPRPWAIDPPRDQCEDFTFWPGAFTKDCLVRQETTMPSHTHVQLNG